MSTHKVNTSLKGYIVEVKAELWLRNQGYLVFYNHAPCGKADMVIWDEEASPIPIDVKSWNSSLYADLLARGYPGVKYLWYNADKDQFAWSNEAKAWFQPTAERAYNQVQDIR